DVTDNEAMTAAGKAAIGDQGYLVAETAADDRAGGAQHLRHARRALRALVTDHDHVAGNDAAVEDRAQRKLLGIEHARSARETQAFSARDLSHGALRREVATQDCEMALRLDRVRERANDRLSGG